MVFMKQQWKPYLQFYRYTGEFIKSGKYISNLISKGNRKFYIIKQDDYYGFFLVCDSGPSKGVSIANGGKTKKLTKETDIDWIVQNFSLVISKYLRLLAPLRNIQTHLSKRTTTVRIEWQYSWMYCRH